MAMNREAPTRAVELHRHHQHQRRHRADHHGVQKRLQQGHHALGGRSPGLGRRMGDRGRANSRFVGERRPPHAPDKRRQQPARHHRPRLKCFHHDPVQRWQDELRIDRQHDHATHHIRQAHQRHQFVGHSGDALDSPDDHQCCHQCHDQTEHPLFVGKKRFRPARDVHQLRRDLVHLEHIAAAEGREHAHQREKARQA